MERKRKEELRKSRQQYRSIDKAKERKNSVLID